MARTNIFEYTKNLAKSVVYASADEVKELSPVTADFLDVNKDVLSSIYNTMKDLRSTRKRAASYIKKSNIYEAADEGIKAIFEDIKTGKFYNKERIARFEDRAIGNYDDGMGAGDFDMSDFGDFGSSDNFDFNMDDEDQDTLEESVIMSSKDNAEAISTTVARVGSSQIQASKMNTMMLLNQQVKANSIMEKGFSTIFDRMGEIGKAQADLMTIHAENSKKFYETTTTLLQAQNTILNEILQNQKKMGGFIEEGQKKNNNRITYEDVVSSEGSINIKQYAKNVKTNALNQLPSMVRDMLTGNLVGDESGNNLLALVSSPLQFIPKAIVKTLIPKLVKKSVADFNTTLSGAFSGVLAELSKMKNNDDNEIIRLIGNIFGVQSKKYNKPSTSSYNRGAVPFNGVTQKAIVEVIPGYLRRIESLLSGVGERLYNYAEGKWVTAEELQKEKDNITEYAYRNAYSEVYGQMSDILRSNIAFNQTNWKEFDKSLKSFLANIIEKDYGNPRLSLNEEDIEKLYMKYIPNSLNGDNIIKLLVQAFNSTSRGARSQLSRKAFEARDEIANRLERFYKDNPTALELDNNSRPNDGYSYHENKYTGKRTTKAYPGLLYNKTLDKILDNKGNNVFYYLQNILSEMIEFRQSDYGVGRVYATPAQATSSGGNTRQNTPKSRRGRQYRQLNINEYIQDNNKEKKNRDENEARARRRDSEYDNRMSSSGKFVYNELFDDYDLAQMTSLLSASSKKKYGRSNVDEYLASQEVQSYLAEENTWINRSADRARTDRKEIVKKVLERAQGKNKNTRAEDIKLVDKLLAAENVTERMAIVNDSLDNVLKHPTRLMTNIMLKADERLYNLVFGNEKGEVHQLNGKPVNSMMSEIVYQIKNTFGKVNDWITDKILKPMKEAGITGPGGFFKWVGQQIGLNLKEAFSGVKDKFGKFKENVKDQWSKMGDVVKNWFRDDTRPEVEKRAPTERDKLITKITQRNATRTENRNLTNQQVETISKLLELSDIQRIENPSSFQQSDEIIQLATKLYGNNNVVKDINEVPIEIINKFIKNKGIKINGKTSISNVSELDNISQDQYSSIVPILLELATKEKDAKDEELRKYVRDNNIDTKFLQDVYNDNKNASLIVSRNKLYNQYQLNDQDTPIDMTSETGRNFVRGKLDRIKELKNLTEAAKKYKNIPTIDTSKFKDMTAEDINDLISRGKQYLSHKEYEKYKNLGIFDIDDNGVVTGNENDVKKVVNAINKAITNFNKNSYADAADNVKNILKSSPNNIYNIAALKDIGVNVDDEGNINIDDFDKFIKILSTERSVISQAAKGARYITKTGLTTIHEGEMVIPSELNPYNPNRGKVSKSKEIRDENRVKNSFLRNLSNRIKSRATGDTGATSVNQITPISGTAEAQKLFGDNSANSIITDPDTFHKTVDKDNNVIYEIKDSKGVWYEYKITEENAQKAGLSFDPNILDVPPANTPVSIKKLGKNPSEAIDKKFTELYGEKYIKAKKTIGKHAAGVAAGSALGGAAGLASSMVFGLPGGPLIGAAIGAISNLAMNSEAVSNFLFGKIELDEDGNVTGRTGGLISDGMQKAFKKHAPSMLKGAGIGTLASFITPLGPIGGALIGSTIGYISKNEEFSGMIFGEDGIWSLDQKEKFKKALPRAGIGAAAGALAGLFGGPFGIVGGALLGTAGGFLSTSERFKDVIFGKETEIGQDDEGNPIIKRKGGLVGALSKVTVEPLKDTAKFLKDNFKTFVQRDILTPLKDGVKPITNMFKNAFTGLKDSISNGLNRIFEEKLGTPLGDAINDRIIAPLSGFARKAMMAPFKVIGRAISAPFKVLGFVGNNIRANQIKKGKDLGSTAEERLMWREEHKIRSKKIFGFGSNGNRDGYLTADTNIANSDNAGIQNLLDQVQALQVNTIGSEKSVSAVNGQIQRLVMSKFDDRKGHSAKIFRYLKDPIGYTSAYKLIRTLPSRTGKPLSPEEAEQMIQQLETLVEQRNYILGAKKLSQKEVDTAKEQLKNFGFHTKRGKFNYDNIIRTLQDEVKGRKKEGRWDTEEETDITDESSPAGQLAKALNPTNSILEEILNAIKSGNAKAVFEDDQMLLSPEAREKIEKTRQDTQLTESQKQQTIHSILQQEREKNDKVFKARDKYGKKANKRNTKNKVAANNQIDINRTRQTSLNNAVANNLTEEDIKILNQNGLNSNDKVYSARVKQLSQVSKTYKLNGEVISILANLPDTNTGEDIYDFILKEYLPIIRFISPDRAEKIIGKWSDKRSITNIRLYLNTINSYDGYYVASTSAKLRDKLIKGILDDKSFENICEHETNKLKSKLKNIAYNGDAKITDFLRLNFTYKTKRSPAMYNIAEEDDGEYDYLIENGTATQDHTAVVSRGEVIVPTDNTNNQDTGERRTRRRSNNTESSNTQLVPVASYAEGTVGPLERFARRRSLKRKIKVIDKDINKNIKFNKRTRNELGIGKEYRAQFDYVNDLLSGNFNKNGVAATEADKTELAKLIDKYYKTNTFIGSIDKREDLNDEQKNKIKEKQTSYLEKQLNEIKTYLSYQTTDDGDTFKKLINKKGNVYVNKLDPKNKKALAEGEVNNQSREHLKNIDKVLGKIHYGVFEKDIDGEGNTVSDYTSKILKTLGKGLLIASGAGLLSDLLFGKGGAQKWLTENVVPTLKEFYFDKVQPKIGNVIDKTSEFLTTKVPEFLTQTLPSAIGELFTGLFSKGAEIGKFLFSNLGNIIKFGSNFIKGAVEGIDSGLSQLGGGNVLSSSGNSKGAIGRTTQTLIRGMVKGTSGALTIVNMKLPTFPGRVVSKAFNKTSNAVGNTIEKLSPVARSGTKRIVNGLSNTFDNVGDEAIKTAIEKATKKAVEETGERASKYSFTTATKVLSSTILDTTLDQNQVNTVIDSVAKSNTAKKVAEFFAIAAKRLKKAVTDLVGSSTANVVDRSLRGNVGKRIVAAVGDKISGGLAKLAAKVASAPISTVAGPIFAIADLIAPFTNDAEARYILGINQPLTGWQRLVAAIINVLKDIPIIGFIIGLFPEDLISYFAFDVLFSGVDIAGITTARNVSRKVVDAFNEVYGTNITIDEYNQIVNGDMTYWSMGLGGVIDNATGNTKEQILAELKAKAAENGIELTDEEIAKWKGTTINADTGAVTTPKNVGTRTITSGSNGTVTVYNDNSVTNTENNNKNNYESNYATETKTTNGLLQEITNILQGFKDTLTGNSSGADETSSDQQYEDLVQLYMQNYNYSRSMAEQQVKTDMGMGSGRYSQKDKSINMRYNKPGDTVYQDINSSGCGPIAATNLINRNIQYGMGMVNPSDAANYALDHGYKETNGGTDPKYFTDYLNKNGISSKITTNKSAIKSAIANGQQVVLMGKDATYGMGSTPYGPNPHYVVATGLSGNNIVVDNPEEENEYTLYDTNSTLNKSTKAIITNSKAKYGMGTKVIHTEADNASRNNIINSSKNMYDKLSQGLKNIPNEMNSKINIDDLSYPINIIPYADTSNYSYDSRYKWLFEDGIPFGRLLNETNILKEKYFANDAVLHYLFGGNNDSSTFYKNASNSKISGNNINGILSYQDAIAKNNNGIKYEDYNKNGGYDNLIKALKYIFHESATNEHKISDINGLYSIKSNIAGVYEPILKYFKNEDKNAIGKSATQNSIYDLGPYIGTALESLDNNPAIAATTMVTTHVLNAFRKNRMLETYKKIRDLFSNVIGSSYIDFEYNGTSRRLSPDAFEQILLSLFPMSAIRESLDSVDDKYPNSSDDEKERENIKSKVSSDIYNTFGIDSNHKIKDWRSLATKYITNSLESKYVIDDYGNKKLSNGLQLFALLNAALGKSEFDTITNYNSDIIKKKANNKNDSYNDLTLSAYDNISNFVNTDHAMRTVQKRHGFGKGTSTVALNSYYNKSDELRNLINIIHNASNTNGTPDFITPRILTNIYGNLLEASKYVYSDLYNGEHLYQKDNRIEQFLRKINIPFNYYKTTSNVSSDNDRVPTFNDYTSDNNNIARYVLKFIKGLKMYKLGDNNNPHFYETYNITDNLNTKDYTEYYDDLNLDTDQNPLAIASAMWSKDLFNVEDFPTLYDSDKGTNRWVKYNNSPLGKYNANSHVALNYAGQEWADSMTAADAYFNNPIKKIFREYNEKGKQSSNYINNFVNYIKSIIYRDKNRNDSDGYYTKIEGKSDSLPANLKEYNLLLNNFSSDSHTFTEEDREFLNKYKYNLENSVAIHQVGSQYNNRKIKDLVQDEAVNKNEKILAYKRFFDFVNKLNNTYSGHTNEQYMLTTKSVIDSVKEKDGSTIEYTSSDIIRNLLNAIEIDPLFNSLNINYQGGGLNSYWDDNALYYGGENTQHKLMLKVLSDYASADPDKLNGIDLIRHAFAKNGPMPESLFRTLYLDYSLWNNSEDKTKYDVSDLYLKTKNTLTTSNGMADASNNYYSRALNYYNKIIDKSSINDYNIAKQFAIADGMTDDSKIPISLYNEYIKRFRDLYKSGKVTDDQILKALQSNYENKSSITNGEFIFKYLPKVSSESKLQLDIGDMASKLLTDSSSWASPETYQTIYDKYLIKMDLDNDKNNGSTLELPQYIANIMGNTTFGLNGGGNTDSTEEYGKGQSGDYGMADNGDPINASNSKAIDFSNLNDPYIVYEDLRKFSNLSDLEIDRWINRAYDGANTPEQYRILKGMATTINKLATTYKVNPRLVLAVMHVEFNIGKAAPSAGLVHIQKYNYLSLMRSGQTEAKGMVDFSNESTTVAEVKFDKIDSSKSEKEKIKQALEHVFRYFSKVSFEKRKQYTLFSLNYRKGCVYCGTREWIEAVANTMCGFTKNEKATYIYPTDAELRFYKTLEGANLDETKLPEKKGVLTSLSEALRSMLESIWGSDIVSFFLGGNASSNTDTLNTVLGDGSTYRNAIRGLRTTGSKAAADFFELSMKGLDGATYSTGPYAGDDIIVSNFGPRTGFSAAPIHYGIDIAPVSRTSANTQIFSPVSGEVLAASYNNGGYGNRVIIEDDDPTNSGIKHRHIFGHLHSIDVTQGQHVNRADRIGIMGSTGLSTGTHLHYGVAIPHPQGDIIPYHTIYTGPNGGIDASTLAPSGEKWSEVTNNDGMFSSSYGWVDPNEYLSDYFEAIEPEQASYKNITYRSTTSNSSAQRDLISINRQISEAETEEEAKKIIDKYQNFLKSIDAYQTKTPMATTGMGSGKTSLSDKLIQNQTKELNKPGMGMGGGEEQSYAVNQITAPKSVPPKQVKNNKPGMGMGGEGNSFDNSTAKTNTILEDVKNLLTSINNNTAINNKIMVAFLNAVRNGEISPDSKMYSSIVNAFANNSTDGSNLDNTSKALVNTLNSIATL